MKKYPLYIFILSLSYLLYENPNSKYIIAGIGIFVIGMRFMEDGFKLFTGGVLEKLISKTTDTTFKSISLGVVSTALLQSSSLVSIIIISFLSAKIISLAGALGVVFGSAVVNEKLETLSSSMWKSEHINPRANTLNKLLMQNTITGCTMMINRTLAMKSLSISSNDAKYYYRVYYDDK